MTETSTSAVEAGSGGAGWTATGTVISTPSPAPDLDFRCPRCQRQSAHRFYGPCPSCVGELRATLRSDAAEILAPEYEPKMNVTPNAVALKED